MQEDWPDGHGTRRPRESVSRVPETGRSPPTGLAFAHATCHAGTLLRVIPEPMLVHKSQPCRREASRPSVPQFKLDLPGQSVPGTAARQDARPARPRLRAAEQARTRDGRHSLAPRATRSSALHSAPEPCGSCNVPRPPGRDDPPGDTGHASDRPGDRMRRHPVRRAAHAGPRAQPP